MHEEIKNVLKTFGLRDIEIDIYLAGLSIGSGTAYEIAKTAGVKRPTAYALIDELVSKNLFQTEELGGKLICRPVPPRELLDIWRGRVGSLEAVTPSLNNLYQQKERESFARVFEGVKGVDAIYNEFTVSDTKGEEILVMSSMDAFAKNFPHQLTVWKKLVKNKRNRIREIITAGEGAGSYGEIMKKLGNPNYQLKILDQKVLGSSDFVLFRDKVALFSLVNPFFAVIIKSSEIAQSQKFLFEAAWKQAKLPAR